MSARAPVPSRQGRGRPFPRDDRGAIRRASWGGTHARGWARPKGVPRKRARPRPGPRGGSPRARPSRPERVRARDGRRRGAEAMPPVAAAEAEAATGPSRARMSRVRESTRGARMGGRGRAEAEGSGPGALPRVRIEGPSEARGDRRPPPGGTGSDQPCGLSRSGPQGRRAEGGERERPSTRGRTPSRAEGSARQAPRRRDQPCGLSRDEGRTCAGEARGADARSAPAGPAGRRRTGARWSENQPCGLFERRRAGGRRRQGSLCSFTPVAVESAFSCENVRQNGGTRRCTSAIRHHLLCLIARRTGVSWRREKGKLFCLGALPAAPAPHFTLFRATVWRQREKVSTSGAQASQRTQVPCGSDVRERRAGHLGARVHRPRPSAALPRRLLRRRVHAAAAARRSGCEGPASRVRERHPGAARRAVLLAPSLYPGCLRGSDARERRAKASGSARQGASRVSARARGATAGAVPCAGAVGPLAPRAGGPRAPWGGSRAQAPAQETLAQDPRGRGTSAQPARAGGERVLERCRLRALFAPRAWARRRLLAPERS